MNRAAHLVIALVGIATISASPSPRISYEVVLSPKYDWENGVVSSPCVWKARDGFRMAYVGDPSLIRIGFARSGDGRTWKRDNERSLELPEGSTYVTNPAYVPRLGYMLAQASNSAGMTGLATYEISSRAVTLKRFEPLQPGIHHISPGSVVAVRDTYYLFTSAIDEANRNAVFRFESADGLRWSNARKVLAPGVSGFDAGHITLPFVDHTAATGEWTMYYIANSHASGPSEGVLCRAFSGDGVRWNRREIVARPEWLSPDFIYLSYPCVVRIGDETRIFITAHLNDGTKKIVSIAGKRGTSAVRI